MRKSIFFLAVLLVHFYNVSSQSFNSNEACLKRIKSNYIRSLVAPDKEKDIFLKLLSAVPAEKKLSDQNIVELYQNFPVGKETAEQLVNTLKADGSWPDINYKDKKRSGWEPRKHPARILDLTKYYYNFKYNHIGSSIAGLEEAIHRSLNFWFHRDFTCLNWWYNQIGIPRTLGPVFLLFEAELTPEEKKLAVKEMEYAKFGMTGQNKVWLAGNVLMRGLLQNDYALVKAARDQIVAEVVLGKKEGIKSDWSFHQHGPQQQWGNYGLSFLDNMCAYVELFAHTPLAFSSEQQNILFSFFREAYRWIVWRGYWDINALDRQLFYQAAIHKSYTLLFAAYSLMQGSTPAQAREIRKFIRANFTAPGRVNTLVGNRVFWDSDQTIHRTSHWMASVKMASERVIGTEFVNEDNKKGYYMADGAMYIYTAGNEYHNIFPFWDWRKVPGITCKESDEPIPARYGGTRNQSTFVGGVTNGNTGITAMVLNRDGVIAHKSWIFTDEFVLCLGSNIHGEHAILTTSIDQCIKSGEFFIQEGKRSWTPVNRKYMAVPQPLRFFHGNTGYIVLQADTCVATVENRNGQWFEVMGVYPPETLQQEVAGLYVKHQKQRPATYQYLVLPASSLKKVEQFDLQKLNVIRNDKEAQVVRIGKKYYIAAYAACEVKLPGDKKLQIHTPGLFLIEYNRKVKNIQAADPTRTQSVLRISMDHKLIKLPIDLHGFATIGEE